MPSTRYRIDALANGLEILSLFSTERPTMNLTDVVAATNLNKSTIFRILSTLESMGYLERNPSTRSFRPGLKVLQLGYTALNTLEIVQVAQPILKSLSDETGETTNMAIRDGVEIVYIARNVTQKIISVNLFRGSRLPVYCTSMGKSLLIDMPTDELVDLLGNGPFPSKTPNTITYVKDLIIELEKIRKKGYSINDEELTFGLRSVAAPVRDRDRNVIAAINVSVPGPQMTRQDLEQFIAPKVIRAAELISLSIGDTYAN